MRGSKEVLAGSACYAKRLVAICAILSFTIFGLPDCPRAEEQNSALSLGSESVAERGPDIEKKDILSARLPLSLGYTREVYDSGTDMPVIVYLQDAHCNYSCQKSIAGIIDYFNRFHGVKLAGLEGGSGNYDFSLFTSIPDIDIRENIADYFVREGRVTGAELFAIMNPERISVKGLEEPGLYEKNLTVYRESLGYKERVQHHIKILN
ncbi:MAG: hypothetical protein ABH885_03695, partial [Candidatus Omnitrophota bacterium]